MKLSTRSLRVIAWSLSSVVSVIAFIAWAQRFAWHFSLLSTYRLFPLFGLLAFSLMWSHYVAAALRQYAGAAKETLESYFEITGLVVLACILLHPILLIWQLWRDGFGLPPGSYKFYVSSSLEWVVLLGTASWLVFIAYEFRRKYAVRSWWRYLQYASDAAMLTIFYHGFRLGVETHRQWFRPVWIFYGVTLAGVLIYQYWPRTVGRSVR